MSERLSEIRKLIEVNRTDELAELSAAATKLGDIKLRVIDDPKEACEALFTQAKEINGRKYPGATDEQLETLAEARWPQHRIEEYTAKDAAHRVVEFTFTGEHGRRDLYDVAVHGGLHGRHRIS